MQPLVLLKTSLILVYDRRQLSHQYPFWVSFLISYRFSLIFPVGKSAEVHEKDFALLIISLRLFWLFFPSITVEWPELWPERYAIDVYTAKIMTTVLPVLTFALPNLLNCLLIEPTVTLRFIYFISYNKIKFSEHLGCLCSLKWLRSETCRSDTLISSYHVL